ncbi:hypothetical protein NCC49_003242 [Naganishia albida]|nr:hypothetical protein NCC49_003242 [Naganishia albida]
MSSRRTSSRTKTVTPGRSVTTLKNPAKTVPRNPGKSSQVTRADEQDDESEPESELSEEDHDDEDVYRGSEEDEVTQGDTLSEDEMDSDDIDEPTSKRAGSKRKANGSNKKSPAKKQKVVKKATPKPVKTASATKKNGKSKVKAGDNYPSTGDSDAESEVQDGGDDYSSYSDGEGDGDSDESLELEEGQEIKGRIFSAPKTGHVPPGQISRNTFKFLVNLQDPEKNDREWFKMREPAYRLAEQEWKDFVSILARRFREVDPELPILPPKDLIHRIYRDVRFSNDKTPYKKHFSMSISRSGRKGIWAGLQPRGRSLIAGGVWGPGKNELASIRHAIKTDSSQIRNIISAPDFTKLFGPASPNGKGKGARCNVFGHDDQLKVAPKGIAKDHKDIDLLKLRSIAVVKNFTDEEVLSPDFMDILLIVASKIQPLAHYLNSVIALPAPTADEAA